MRDKVEFNKNLPSRHLCASSFRHRWSENYTSDDTLKVRKPWDWTWKRSELILLACGDHSETPSATSAIELIEGLNGQGG